MRRLFSFLLVFGTLGLGAFWLLTWPALVSDADVASLTGDPVVGEDVFWAAGCASCHAGPDAGGNDRLILAGGQAFP